MMDVTPPEVWYRSLPVFTRTFLTVCFATTLLCTLELLDVRIIMFDARSICNKWQVWRVVTDFFFMGKFSFGWMFEMYFLTTFSSKLENHRSMQAHIGNYLWFLVIQVVCLDIVTTLLNWPTGSPFNGPAIVYAIVYYWSRKEPYAQLSYWGFLVKAYQLPFWILAFDLLFGHSLWTGLMGLLTGHVYYFLKDVLPAEKNIRLIDQPPAIVEQIAYKYSLWMSNRPPASGSSPRTLNSEQPPQPPPPRPPSSAGPSTMFGGRGYRLGGDQ